MEQKTPQKVHWKWQKHTLRVDSKKLEETTAELKRTAFALEKEKEKTAFLLHQMLPKKVADQLRDGRKVDAGTFVCLFSPFFFETIQKPLFPM